MASARLLKVPFLVGTSGGQFELVVAHRALDVASHRIATVLSAELPVEHADFSAVMDVAHFRELHVTDGIFAIRKILGLGLTRPRSSDFYLSHLDKGDRG